MSVMTSAAKARILVVEDDIAVARDLCRRIERLGYHLIDVCTSCEHALEVARETRPDLLLMDVRLNGVDESLAVSRRQLTAVREALAG